MGGTLGRDGIDGSAQTTVADREDRAGRARRHLLRRHHHQCWPAYKRQGQRRDEQRRCRSVRMAFSFDELINQAGDAAEAST